MCALASGNAAGSAMRMLIVCSSTRYDAVISRARGATLTVKGESESDSACSSDHVVTDCSAADMTGGEMCFSVHGSSVTTVARDLQSMNHDFVRDGTCRRQRKYRCVSSH
jgi:hypothetical protein